MERDVSMKAKLKKIEDIINDDLDYLVMLEKRGYLGENYITICRDNVLKDFLWFKNRYQYAVFAEIIFWVNDDEFLDHQNDIIEYRITDKDKYICIGEVEPYPIFINKESGDVLIITSTPGNKCIYKNLGKFDNFIKRYVLGDKYPLIGSDEEWIDFLTDNKLI